MSRFRVSGDTRITARGSHGPHKGSGGHTVEVEGPATPVMPANLSPLDFPKPWLYYGTNGAGSELMTAPGVFDSALVTSVARFPLVTLNTTPFANAGGGNRGIIALLKAIRPTMRILWYDTFVSRFLFATANTQWKAEWDAVVASSPDCRFYFESDGTGYPNHAATPIFIDTGKIKEALFTAWIAYAGADVDADGFFLDYADGILALGSTQIDLARAGYANINELNASAKAGLDYVVDGLATLGEVWGNGLADADSMARWTGRLFEGWDRDGGLGSRTPLGFATFDDAMNEIMEWQGATPTANGTCLLKSENAGTSYGTNAWFKMQRYTLGCATVGGGYGYTGDNRNESNLVPDDADMWADEYSVISGASETTGIGIGWLGRPTEFGYKDSGSGLYIRHFDNGVVVANASAAQKTIDLGTQYRRINGSLQPSVNDGSLVQSVTVPHKDARFLLSV